MANIQTNSLTFPGLSDTYQFNKVTNNAPAYDSTKTYAVGDLCSKDNVVYKCSTAIATAEAWTAGHWTQVSLGEEIAGVKESNSELRQELNQEKKYQLLLDDSVPNTVQEYTFSGGAVSQVTHKRSGTTIRTDAFTYGTSSITEVRTLNTGESMTIATNLETLETSVTYTAA